MSFALEIFLEMMTSLKKNGNNLKNLEKLVSNTFYLYEQILLFYF